MNPASGVFTCEVFHVSDLLAFFEEGFDLFTNLRIDLFKGN